MQSLEGPAVANKPKCRESGILMGMEDLESLIHTHGLTPHRDLIRALVRPSIAIKAIRTEQGRFSPDDSRFGGLPHLPRGMDWPTWRGTPLDHVATIRLSDAAEHDASGTLPREGFLWFFVVGGDTPWGSEAADLGFMRVIYEPSERVTLGLASPSAGSFLSRILKKDRARPFPPCRVQFAPSLTLPDFEWIHAHAPHASALASLDAYSDLVDALRDQAATPHRLLGWPMLIQNPWEDECNVVARALAATAWRPTSREAPPSGPLDWQLLLQLGSDDAPGWCWGDLGNLYFTITRQSLAARRFDRSWMILQCF